MQRAALLPRPCYLTFADEAEGDAYVRRLEQLLDRGVVVRDVGRYPGLAGCLRLSIGAPAENDAALGVLAARREAA